MQDQGHVVNSGGTSNSNKEEKASVIVIALTSHMFNMDIYSAFRTDHMLRQAAPVSVNVAFLIVFQVVILSI